MKSFKKIIISLIALLAGATIAVSFSGGKKAFAEVISQNDYIVFEKEYYNETLGEYEVKENAAAVKNGDAIFLAVGERVRLGVGVDRNGEQYSDKIASLTYKITVNGTTFDNQPSASMEMYGMTISRATEGRNFDLAIDPKVAEDNDGTFGYGKYTFEFSYYFIDENLNPQLTSASYTLYILNYNDYYNNAQFMNAKTTAVENRYYSNYATEELMYLNYDYRFFNLKINRVYQGLSSVTTIKYVGGQIQIASVDENGQITTKHNTDIWKTTEGTRAYVIFRNLGVYYLTYEPINSYGSNEVISQFYNDGNKALTTSAVAQVFGYQLYYTSQSGLAEFKLTNANTPWKVDGTEFSADVTSLVADDYTDLYSIETNQIAKTNQPLIYPQTNAILNIENSKYYYYSTAEEFEAQTPTEIMEDYSGTPVSKLGFYIFELEYVYGDYSGEAQKQYFLFRVTSDAPVVDIYTLDENDEHTQIVNDEFTYKNVYITKSALGVFDSSSVLRVYKDVSFNGVYDAGTVVGENNVVEFSQTARYKVELTYGNTSKKGFTSYFTIDKEQISEIEFKNLYEQLGYNLLVGDVLASPYYTNNAVALSWKEKASGAVVTAEYKFFASKYSATNASSLTSDALKTLYNSQQLKYSIPSTHIISYAGGTMPVSNYQNTYGKSILTEEQALTAAGLYIFYIYDSTGAEGQYFAIFIDKTPNSIITVTEDVYSIVTDHEVTTKDTTAYFGKNKLIKIDTNVNAEWDSWLTAYLTGANSAVYKNETYLKIGIANKVYFTKDSIVQNAYTLSALNDYGFAMFAETDGVSNESQYIFYTICESTKTNSVYDKNSFNYYKDNYTASHSIMFSTDNSRMIVYYTEEGSTRTLQQCQVTATASSKTNYFQPTAKETLAKAGEILRFSYCIKPSDTMEVQSIEIKYYAFEEDGGNPTYKFNLNSPTASITIYQKDAINWGTEIEGQLNTYYYEINKETYEGSNTRTKMGRYEIIRTYTDETILSANDPKERKLVFIVDRNGIISDPSIDQNGNAVYYTGSGIQLQIINKYGLNYYNEETLHFYDLYYASKLSQTSLVPVVTTNFLPVTLYVPTYKYGYVANESGYPVFKTEDTIVSYGVGGNAKKYSNYKLTAVVDYYKSSSLTSKTNTYLFDTALSSNFLTTSGSGNSIIAFNQEGLYRATITSEAGDTFSFVFEIKYSSPEFDLLDTENTPITSDQNGVFYTNKDVVRIAWEDSPNKYLARINQNAIQYTINGVTGVIDPTKTPIQTNGENKYYVDLDLTALGAYSNNTNVYITLQFNGKKEDYNNSEHFSKTVQLKVDLEAPTTNILGLTSLTGLDFYSLRKYSDGYKYNMSVSSGLYRYFAYNIDKANFQEIIKAPADTSYDYYKMYFRLFQKDGVNTKYIAGGNNETDITLADLTGQMSGTIWGDSYSDFNEILKNGNVYIELVEEDFAGNRTVYTIYLSDIASHLQETAINYSYLTNTSSDLGETTKEITFEEIGAEMSLYSKYSFNLESLKLFENADLGDLTWQLVKVQDVLYVKSPYSNGKFYRASTYSENRENETYTLKELTLLYSSSSSQKIELYMMPTLGTVTLNVYVLNKTLEMYTLSQVNNNNLCEGLLVKLPVASTNANNVLYATSLSIKATFGGSFVTTYEIDAKFLKEEQTEIPSLNNIALTYVTYKGGKYLQVEVLGNISVNDYFIYTLTDNFGEEYNIVHIYGQTEINDPITSDGHIAMSYDASGAIVYYASENIRYKYDTTIYEKVNISVGKAGAAVSEASYTIIKSGATYLVLQSGTDTPANAEEYGKYFAISVFNNVFSIEMLQMPYDFANGELGGSRTFALELVPKADFNIDSEKVRFEIFNELPSTLSIISKNSAVDVTSILGGNRAYAGAVIINYVYLTLKFDYEILIMNPNGDIMALTDEMEISEDGTYKIIINYLGDINGCSKTFEFTIANSDEFIYSVAVKLSDGTYRNIEATGLGYTYTEHGVSTTITTHFIVNGEYQIILNSNLYLTATIEKGPIDNYTYIYKISNLDAGDDIGGLVTEFYSAKVAISVIPKTGDILKRLVHYGTNIKEQTDDLLTLSNPSITPYVTTKDEYDAGIRIAWSKYNLIPENTIDVVVYYGDVDGVVYNAKVEEINSLNSITLKTSGTYYIKFQDKAGNVQLFGAYADNEYFTIKYLSSVIFEIDGQAPINYAIYDTDVAVSIPDITIGYYDVNAKPVIKVELNGVEYKDYEKVSQYSWIFSEQGLYKIWFTAKIDEKSIYEAPIYFTILSSKESRFSYTYTGYSKYYLQDIKLDGVSVNSRLANINNGELININGVDYLKTLTLHSSDIKTGNGYWTFVVNTNNEFNQTFEFTIRINKANVPIKLSVANGTTTTENVIVSFNTQNLLNATGDCYLKITGHKEMLITEELLEAGELQAVYEITLAAKGSYYIEVTSLSGQLLYSSYIVKAEPLNAVSIIIIVVSALVVGVGVVLFVLLRRRMKIR